MPIDCLVHIKGNHELESYFKDVKTREEAIDLAKKYHEKLHSELNNFKKSIGVKTTEFKPIDNTPEIEKTKADYQEKIDAAKAKLNETTPENKVSDTPKETGNTEELVDNPIQQTGEGGKEPPVVTHIDTEGDKTGGISKKALKKDYDFTKEFPSKSDQVIADKAMDDLHQSAKNNNVTPEQQAANEVALMKNKTGEASEHDIMTAVYHLRNLDEQIKSANNKGEDATHLLNQREEALTTLRQLGNNAGRNLRLFGSIYKKVEGNRLEVVRAQLKKDLGVDNIPKSMDELKKSNLSNADKKKIEPYVKAIENLNKTLSEVDKKAEKATMDINDKEVQDYIKKEIAKGLKGTKASKAPPTKSIRSKEVVKAELDKVREQFRKDSQQMSSGGLQSLESFVKMVKLAIEYGVKSAVDFIKEFKDDFKGHSESDIEKGFNKVIVSEKKNDAIIKIAEIAKNDAATSITPDMVKNGLINDIVNDYIHSDIPYDKVISEATKEINQSLPDTTDQQVADAILRRGEFKQKTKKQIEAEEKLKMQDVKRLAATKNKVDALTQAQDIHEIKFDNTLSEKEKKAAIEKRKADYEKELDKKIAEHEQRKKDAIENAKKNKAEYKRLETERNRQLQKVADLTEKRDKLLAGIRETADKLEPKVDTPEIEALKKQISDADKALREIENAQSKAKRDADNLAEQLGNIDEEIAHVKNTRTIFDKAIKDPKSVNDQLKASKESLKQAYAEAGLRKEPGSKNEIKIAQDAETAIKEINDNKSLSDDIKKQHIADIKAQRDAALAETKQGVLSNLKDAIDNHVSDLSGKINDIIGSKDAEGNFKDLTPEEKDNLKSLKEVKKDLQDLSDRLKPNVENLKDQIDKADQDLQAIIKANEGTEFEKDLKDIQKDYHDNWQKTADELQHQALIKKAEQSLKESKRRKDAGQYTEIPTTPYDVSRDAILAQKEAESKKAWSELNSMSIKAKEQQLHRSLTSKLLEARRTLLIMSFGAIEKVAGSGITKPIIDPLIKQTFGRISGAITGIKATSTKLLGDTYMQFKDEESVNKFMAIRNDQYINAIINHSKIVKEFGIDSNQAKESDIKLKEAEIAHLATIPRLFINAGSHIDIQQVIMKGATDFDAKMGKYQQSLAKERTKLQNVYFWIESMNRTHSAIKSVSHRQALIDHYIENLQYFQSKEGSISDESRQRAWDTAVLSSEEGRFGESTQLSRWIGRAKSSSNPIARNAANYLLPVAKISINITKQGVDMAFPFVEAGAKGMNNAIHGMKINAEEGKQYTNFVSKFSDGIKRSFNELPLEQKKYINTLIARGLFGVTQYALIGYGLASGNIKYGGMYDPSDPFSKNKVKGADGMPLKNGEWEFFGEKAPKLLNIVINHSPYGLPSSIAAVSYEQLKSDDKKGLQIYHAFNKTANEVYERLPFVTGIDVYKALTGDDYKLQNIIANEVPTAKATAEFFDKDTEGNTRAVQVKGDGFWSTVGNIVQSKTPFYRNYLPSKTGVLNMESDTFKFLANKGLGIVPYSKEKLKPINEDGLPIKVTDEKYKEFLDKRQLYVETAIKQALNKGGSVDLNPKMETPEDSEDTQSIADYIATKNEGIKKMSAEDFKKSTSEQLRAWLMSETKNADKWAIGQVFKGKEKTKDKPEAKILPIYPEIR